jgi:hypothetical protein
MKLNTVNFCIGVGAKMHTGQLPVGQCHAVNSSVNVCLNTFALLHNWFCAVTCLKKSVVELKLLICENLVCLEWYWVG